MLMRRQKPWARWLTATTIVGIASPIVETSDQRGPKMITSLFTLHGHNEQYVLAVMDEMRNLGAPKIRVVDCGDHYVAIEGVHRLEASARLGIAPNLVVLDKNEMIEADSLDIEIFQSGENYTAGEIAGKCYSQGSGCYHIDEDGTLTLVFNGRWVPDA